MFIVLRHDLLDEVKDLNLEGALQSYHYLNGPYDPEWQRYDKYNIKVPVAGLMSDKLIAAPRKISSDCKLIFPSGIKTILFFKCAKQGFVSWDLCHYHQVTLFALSIQSIGCPGKMQLTSA
jgi:hypothetical protein